MWVELLRSRAVVDTLLLLMLLAWLAGSAIMTLRAGHGAAPRASKEQRRQEPRTARAPSSNGSTMPPRTSTADSLRS